MKLNISTLFDIATLAATKIAQDIQPFVEHYNKAIGEIARALKNQLTFADNFNCEVLEVKLKHGRRDKLKIKEANVLGVIPVKTLSSSDAVASLIHEVDQSQQLLVTPSFKLASTTELTVTLVILYR